MKTELLKLRISEREKEIVRKRAEELQMSMSEYIVYLIRKDNEKSE